MRKVKEAVLAVKLERELEQGRDPRALPQHHLLRPRRLRRGRRRPRLLRQGRATTSASSRRPTWPGSSARRAAPTPSRTRRRRPVVVSPCSRRWPPEGYISGEDRDVVDAVADPDRRRGRAKDRQGLGRVEGNTADDNIGTKYFVEAVRRQIAERYGEDILYGGGLRIYTTIDFDMQRAAWDAVTSTLDQPTDPDAALVAVDEYGFVKAMVGGRDFEDGRGEPRPRAPDRPAVPGRGAGSSFKPFVLAEAIRQDISLNSKFDAPGHDHLRRTCRARSPASRLEGGQLRRHRAGRARPRRRHPGVVQHRLRAAHARGRARQRGHPRQPPRRVAPSCPAVPALVLGSGDVSPLDMAVGYSTFANRGRAQRPDHDRQDRAGRRGRRRRA